MVCLLFTSLTSVPTTLFLAHFVLVTLASSLFLKHSWHVPFSEPLISLISLLHISETKILVWLTFSLLSGLYSQCIFLVSSSLATLSKSSSLALGILCSPFQFSLELLFLASCIFYLLIMFIDCFSQLECILSEVTAVCPKPRMVPGAWKVLKNYLLNECVNGTL